MVHWAAAKHVLRYLQGTLDFGLKYVRGDGLRLAGYTDSDWAGSVSDWKSTSGCCFGLGSAVVSWFSRKQKSVALSSFEAEYMAASLAIVVRLHGFARCYLAYSESVWSLP